MWTENIQPQHANDSMQSYFLISFGYVEDE